MKIKNYTSSVAASKSISSIETLLVEAGAKTISKFYNDDNSIAGFLFQLRVKDELITFKLPSNPKAVEKVLINQLVKPRRETIKRVKEQADKTSWKLLHDWVHIQLSMVYMEQAEAAQVFLPYAYDGKTDKTLFQLVKENNFKQLSQ